jgi:hypothetical protein
VGDAERLVARWEIEQGSFWVRGRKRPWKLSFNLLCALRFLGLYAV